eukprot:gene31078-6204_t
MTGHRATCCFEPHPIACRKYTPRRPTPTAHPATRPPPPPPTPPVHRDSSSPVSRVGDASQPHPSIPIAGLWPQCHDFAVPEEVGQKLGPGQLRTSPFAAYAAYAPSPLKLALSPNDAIMLSSANIGNNDAPVNTCDQDVLALASIQRQLAELTASVSRNCNNTNTEVCMLKAEVVATKKEIALWKAEVVSNKTEIELWEAEEVSEETEISRMETEAATTKEQNDEFEAGERESALMRETLDRLEQE